VTADVPRRTRPDLPNAFRWSDLAATLQRIDDNIADPYGPSPTQVAAYVASTDADVLRLAEQLEEAGTPDETLIAAELRAAVRPAGTPVEVYDPVTGEYLGTVSGNPAYAPAPTVGFHEPPQPSWLERALARIFR
jgi:hypothetical protein